MQRVVENKWSALNGAQRSTDLTPVTEEALNGAQRSVDLTPVTEEETEP